MDQRTEFEHQLEELCASVEEEFGERVDIEAVRRAIRLARRDGGSLGAFVLEWQPVIAQCAERFLQVLALADEQLEATEVATLDSYVQHRLAADGARRPTGSMGPTPDSA